MHPMLNQTLADTRAWELRREAAEQRAAAAVARRSNDTRGGGRRSSGRRARRARPAAGLPAEAAITIRPAYADDQIELRRLADLDGALDVPAGALLVAEVDGAIRAALGGDGDVIADPFVPTRELIELLVAHAAHAVPARARWFRLPRLTPVSDWRRAAA